MRRDLCKIGMSAVGIAVVTSIAGCGGTEAPGAPSVDSNVAFAQYDEAAKPFECSKAYGEMWDAYHDAHYGIMKDRARQHRDVVATWNDQLSKIEFPVAAQPIVHNMRELAASELTGLNELVRIDDKKADRISALVTMVQADDSSATVEGDRLRETLGHPETQASVAADLLDRAYLLFYKDDDPVPSQFDAALVANDLAAAKAAKQLEVDALQRYIDALGAIDWPPGSFEGQAVTLRKHLQEVIEFDRRQVDVATAAQIVPTPKAEAPDFQAAEAAELALWRVLAQADAAERPGNCS